MIGHSYELDIDLYDLEYREIISDNYLELKTAHKAGYLPKDTSFGLQAFFSKIASAILGFHAGFKTRKNLAVTQARILVYDFFLK